MLFVLQCLFRSVLYVINMYCMLCFNQYCVVLCCIVLYCIADAVLACGDLYGLV